MSKTAVFILMVVFWFGLNFARAEEGGAKIENPATAAVQELNENNIEQALADKEGKAAPQMMGAQAAEVSPQAKESEIPVQLDTKKGSAGEGSPFVKMILGLLVVSGLAVAGWFGVRRYKLTNRTANPATQMKIVSQFHLGPKKSLAIVRVAGESMLIGITDHHISLVKSLALLDEDVPEDSPANFEKVFGKAYQEGGKQAAAPAEGEDFAISGIKDFVSTRLKNMRSFE